MLAKAYDVLFKDFGGTIMGTDKKGDLAATKPSVCDLCHDTGYDLNEEPCPFGCEPEDDLNDGKVVCLPRRLAGSRLVP